jgi:chorismate dehydratase
LVDRKIKVGAVSYLNTKPFIYGLENGPIKEEIDLVVDYPARLVTMLKNGQIDIGLVPVGALPGLGEYHIVSDYCIGTEGEVASVAVFSEVPMEEIENVYLDYQSRTSVLLCKLLFEKHWKRQVNFIEATDESYIQEIKGKTAGLIIGDRALMNRSRFPYIYDLGLGWKEMTGLPFVFAVWVSVVRLDDIFLTKLNQAFTCILDYTSRKRTEDFFGYRLENYFRKNISYKITTDKKEAIELFLHYSSFMSF